jgi:hypothetical protein
MMKESSGFTPATLPHGGQLRFSRRDVTTAGRRRAKHTRAGAPALTLRLLEKCGKFSNEVALNTKHLAMMKQHS